MRVRRLWWLHLIQHGQGGLEHLQQVLTTSVVVGALRLAKLRELSKLLLLLTIPESRTRGALMILSRQRQQSCFLRHDRLVQESVRLATLL